MFLEGKNKRYRKQLTKLGGNNVLRSRPRAAMFVVIFATPSADGVMRSGEVHVRAQDSKGNITSLSHLKYTYYMACSVSGQDGPNPSLCLAARAGKMAPPCPLGGTCCVKRENLFL